MLNCCGQWNGSFVLRIDSAHSEKERNEPAGCGGDVQGRTKVQVICLHFRVKVHMAKESGNLAMVDEDIEVMSSSGIVSNSIFKQQEKMNHRHTNFAPTHHPLLIPAYQVRLLQGLPWKSQKQSRSHPPSSFASDVPGRPLEPFITYQTKQGGAVGSLSLRPFGGEESWESTTITTNLHSYSAAPPHIASSHVDDCKSAVDSATVDTKNSSDSPQSRQTRRRNLLQEFRQSIDTSRAELVPFHS